MSVKSFLDEPIPYSYPRESTIMRCDQANSLGEEAGKSLGEDILFQLRSEY